MAHKLKHLLCIVLVALLPACRAKKIAVIIQNGKYGCINRKGDIVIEPIWDYMLQGDGNRINLVKKDSLFGFINRKGHILIKPQYNDGSLFREGLAPVSNAQNKYGFINSKGDTIIPFVYDDTFSGFSNGLSDVEMGGKCGYIDKRGNVVIPLIYQRCYPFLSQYAQVKTLTLEELLVSKAGKTYKYEEVKRTGKLYVPRDRYPGSFTTSTGQGRMNNKGETIIPPIYKVIGSLSDHMYRVQDKNNKWGAYSHKGIFTIPCQFDEIGLFKEGLVDFKLEGKYGFLDKQGRIVIEPTFDYTSCFHQGLAYAELNGKSGFINKKGTFVIQPIYDLNMGSRVQSRFE